MRLTPAFDLSADLRFSQLGCKFIEGGQSLQLCPLSSGQAPMVAESYPAGRKCPQTS